jgi:hypothetical protein
MLFSTVRSSPFQIPIATTEANSTNTVNQLFSPGAPTTHLIVAPGDLETSGAGRGNVTVTGASECVAPRCRTVFFGLCKATW